MRAQEKNARTIPPAMLTAAEVSALLRIHASTLYRLIRTSQLPHFRAGNDYRFHRLAIDAWRQAREQLQALPQASPAKA